MLKVGRKGLIIATCNLVISRVLKQCRRIRIDKAEDLNPSKLCQRKREKKAEQN